MVTIIGECLDSPIIFFILYTIKKVFPFDDFGHVMGTSASEMFLKVLLRLYYE